MSVVYVATDQSGCGCITAVNVDRPEYAKATARDVAGYIRRGDTVDHVDIEAFRLMPFRCSQHPDGTPAPWELRKAAKAKPRSKGWTPPQSELGI